MKIEFIEIAQKGIMTQFDMFKILGIMICLLCLSLCVQSYFRDEYMVLKKRIEQRELRMIKEAVIN